MAKPLVYISGPFTAATHEERISNVTRAIIVGLAVYEAGGIPFIPHLNVMVGPIAEKLGTALDWSDYMAWDLPIVRRCDGLIRLPGESKGASVEAVLAEDCGLPVMYVESETFWENAVAGDDLRDFIAICEEYRNG